MVDDFDPTRIGGARITWDPTAASDFGSYEIDRSDPYTPAQIIARITDQDVGAFYDWEGRLGVPSSYRIRSVSDVGIHSSWSTPVVVSACAPDCGYTFTSNEAPELNVGYEDNYGTGAAERAYEFPEAAEAEERVFFDRDYRVIFRPLERGGIKFARRVRTSGLAAPARPGPEAFTALRDLAWASLSYVCVRDESGNRWFGSIGVPDGIGHQPGNFTFATVTFAQTTDTPSTPDAVA